VHFAASPQAILREPQRILVEVQKHDFGPREPVRSDVEVGAAAATPDVASLSHRTVIAFAGVFN
jgi:hypothetical protein